MTFKEKLREMVACPYAREWAGEMTMGEAWATCDRADWMIWLVCHVLPGEIVADLIMKCSESQPAAFAPRAEGILETDPREWFKRANNASVSILRLVNENNTLAVMSDIIRREIPDIEKAIEENKTA